MRFLPLAPLLLLPLLSSCSSLNKAVDTADKWATVAQTYQMEFAAYRKEFEAWRAELKRLVDGILTVTNSLKAVLAPAPAPATGAPAPTGLTEILAGGGAGGVLLSWLLLYLRNKKSDERKDVLEDSLARLEPVVARLEGRVDTLSPPK